MATWNSESRFPLPNYDNAYLTFKNGSRSYQINFMISPNSYNVSVSYAKAAAATLSGWHISSAGNGVGTVHISGVLLDSYKLQERLYLLLQFQNLMQDNKNDLKEYMNMYEMSLTIEGVRYRGAVQSFSFSKDQHRQFLYNYSMSFLFVDYEVVDKFPSTIPKYARSRVSGGKSKFSLPYSSLTKDFRDTLEYKEVENKKVSKLYQDTDTSSAEEKEEKEQDEARMVASVSMGDVLTGKDGSTTSKYATMDLAIGQEPIMRNDETVEIQTYLIEVGTTFDFGYTKKSWNSIPDHAKPTLLTYETKRVIYQDETGTIRETELMETAMKFYVDRNKCRVYAS